MKLNLNVQHESKQRQEDLKEELEAVLLTDIVIKNGVIMEADQSTDLNQYELFQMGEDFGRSKEYLKHTAPEEFTISRKFGELLEKALHHTVERTHISNKTIRIKHVNENQTEVSVDPTQITFLFNWFMNYGKMCVLEKLDDKL